MDDLRVAAVGPIISRDPCGIFQLVIDKRPPGRDFQANNTLAKVRGEEIDHCLQRRRVRGKLGP
jgi:hypothetical protein